MLRIHLQEGLTCSLWDPNTCFRRSEIRPAGGVSTSFILLSPSWVDKLPWSSKWTSPCLPATPQTRLLPATGESHLPHAGILYPSSPFWRLFQRFDLNTWVLPCVGVFCIFPGPELRLKCKQDCPLAHGLDHGRNEFLSWSYKFFLDSALMWGLKVDHSTLRKAKCSKDFLQGLPCPGRALPYYYFFYM